MTNPSLLKQAANKVKFMNNRVEILEALCIFFATIACSAKTAYLQKYCFYFKKPIGAPDWRASRQ